MTIFDAAPNDGRLAAYGLDRADDRQAALDAIETDSPAWAAEPASAVLQARRGSGLEEDLAWISAGLDAAYLAGRADVLARLWGLLRAQPVSQSPLLATLGPDAAAGYLAMAVIAGDWTEARAVARALRPGLEAAEDEVAPEAPHLARAMAALVLGDPQGIAAARTAIRALPRPRGQDGLILDCARATADLLEATARPDGPGLARSLAALNLARAALVGQSLDAIRKGRPWLLLPGMFWDRSATAALAAAGMLGLPAPPPSPFADLDFCRAALAGTEHS
ncbi:hypothetical protein [Poseidonocella sp. HB161398]|uniref:hypothetical protein n=1 Tax=Poseidonocella sp. HB161398 TaxID=2320855 RepID=UPI0011084B5B|nr:hypothetical protein [Poseidonocella sp. HB161398]